MGLQNAIVFKLLPRYVPDAVGGASGWIGGLGALGGFVIPPVMGVATGLVGGSVGYARGFLPFAALIAASLPVVIWLSRWSVRHAARYVAAHRPESASATVRPLPLSRPRPGPARSGPPGTRAASPP